MNRKRLIPILVLGGLIAAGIAVDRHRAALHSTLSGVFESQPADMASRIGGRVAKILVKEGDLVHKGTPLIELEADTDTQATEALKFQAGAAKANADLLKSGSRSEDIARQAGVVAELAADLAKAKNGPLPEEVAVARERVAQAKAHLDEVRNGARKEDLAAARAAMDQAQATYQAALRGATAQERKQSADAVESARVQAMKARMDADRSKKLFEEGVISRSDWELDETKAKTAELAVDSAREAYDRLQKGTPKEELAEAQRGYVRARAQYESLAHGSRPEDVRQAQGAYDEAVQSSRLVQRGTRPEDIAAAEARLTQAQAQLNELKNGNRPQQIQSAVASQAAAEAQAKSSEASLAERTILAPTDGVVDRIFVAQGDLVARSAPVLRFTDPTDIWLRVYVPESALAQVNVGDTAALSVDGINQPVAGVVENIATTGEFTPANLQTPEERGKQVFAVRLRLKDKDKRVKAGMAASVKRIGSWQ